LYLYVKEYSKWFSSSYGGSTQAKRNSTSKRNEAFTAQETRNNKKQGALE
jgi:hypothetical protein